MSQIEQMAQMFAAVDDDGRRFILRMLEGEYERVQKARRPVLRLIQGGLPTVAPASKPRAETRTKKKEST